MEYKYTIILPILWTLAAIAISPYLYIFNNIKYNPEKHAFRKIVKAYNIVSTIITITIIIVLTIIIEWLIYIKSDFMILEWIVFVIIAVFNSFFIFLTYSYCREFLIWYDIQLKK